MGNKEAKEQKEKEEQQKIEALEYVQEYSKYTEGYNAILKKSIIIKQNTIDPHFSNVDILQHINNQNFQLVLKEIIYSSEYEARVDLQQFYQRAINILHPNLIQLHSCKFLKHDTFCSKFFKNSLLLDYISKTLEEEMLNMNQISEEDLWFLIDSLIGAMSFLQEKDLPHENLRLSTIYVVFSPQNIKLFKLADKNLMGYDSLFNFGSKNFQDAIKMNGIYLSPEQLELLNKKEKNPTNKYNAFKSDVFTLGMIFAHLCLWKNLNDEIYNYKQKTFIENSITKVTYQIEQKYGDTELTNLIKIMLELDPEKRIDFIQINNLLNQLPNLQNQRICQVLTQDKLSVLMHIPEPVPPPPPQKKEEIKKQDEKNNEFSFHKNPNQEKNLQNIQKQQNYLNPTQVSKIIGQPNNQQQNNDNNDDIFTDPSDPKQQQKLAAQLMYQSLMAQQQLNQLMQSIQNPLLPLIQQQLKQSHMQQQQLGILGATINQNMGSNNLQSGMMMQPQFNPYMMNNPMLANNNNMMMMMPQPLNLQQQQQQLEQNLKKSGQFSEQLLQNQQQNFTLPFNNPQLQVGPLNINEKVFNIESIDSNQLNIQSNLQTNIQNNQQIGQQPNFKLPFQQKDQQQQQNFEFNKIETLNFPNGQKYEGQVKNQKMDGLGKLFYPDNQRYEGTFKNGAIDGQGTLYYSNGKKAYEGGWKNGNFHKYGILYNEFETKTEKELNYDNFTELSDFWHSYEGDFNNSNREGFGIILFSNGEKFSGNFKNNSIHGYGTWYKKNGQIINAYWENDKFIKLI